MPHHRLGKCRALRRVLAALVAAGAMLQGLPFSPEPLFVPAGGAACWFEPLDLCSSAGAFPARHAEMPLLPPPAPETVIKCGGGAVASSAWRPLPDGFPPSVYRPPRRLS